MANVKTKFYNPSEKDNGQKALEESRKAFDLWQEHKDDAPIVAPAEKNFLVPEQNTQDVDFSRQVPKSETCVCGHGADFHARRPKAGGHGFCTRDDCECMQFSEGSL